MPFRIALVTLARNAFRSHSTVEPALHLAASGEVIFLAIALSMIITAIARPSQYHDNAMRAILGYNNPCVFWDKPPALYPAAVLYTIGAYFTIRYAHLDSRRAFLIAEQKQQHHRAAMLQQQQLGLGTHSESSSAASVAA